MGNDDLYNDDELHPPEWMNTDFFQKVLSNVESGNNTKIVDYTITPGTTKSDHYGSVIFRAKLNYTVDGRELGRSFIIKANPSQNGYKKELLGELSLFETEIKMYTETLPKLEDVLRKYGDDTKLCARLFYYKLGENKCIVFEDLVERGYSTISKRACTMTEVKAALLKLAKIHAVSYKLANEGDTTITAYDKGSFNSMDLNALDFVINSIKLFKETISAHSDLRCYLPHIERVEGDILQKCVDTFDAYGKGGEREGMFVLNHGDFHMKNMLTKNVDGVLEDLMLVDYQVSIFGSPAIDVLYSLTMLMSPEMRRDHRDELIYYYFKNFQQVLEKVEFNGPIPTMADFQKELQKHRHFELYMMMCLLIMNYAFCDAKGDLAKIIEDESYRRQMFNNPQLIAELRVLLPRFLYAGYFEN